jgi:hypothetical protein
VSEPPVIRVFRCRPLRGAFDEILRGVMLPELARLPGVTALYAGRQGPDDIGTRVVVSVWTSRAAMEATMGLDVEQSHFHPEYLPETEDRAVEVLPVELALSFDDADGPAGTAILRFAGGRVHAGQMAAYVESVREGTEADVAAGTGPTALFVARQSEDAFLTLSVWRSWSDIQVATGADLTRPVSTRRAEGLVEFEANHYESII